MPSRGSLVIACDRIRYWWYHKPLGVRSAFGGIVLGSRLLYFLLLFLLFTFYEEYVISKYKDKSHSKLKDVANVDSYCYLE